MWLADVGTAVIGIVFLTAPFAPQFNSGPAATWTYVAGGTLLLLLGVAALNYDEYRHPWYVHVGALVVGAWFVLTPLGLPPAGVADGWAPVAGGAVVIVLNAWMAARQLPEHTPAR